jgi:ferritin-like metal-binding protein YciE
MHALQKKVEAMEKVGAGALADQALRKLIRLHLQKYEKQLAEVRRVLEPCEKQYGMSSEACYRRFAAGEMGDAADIMDWMGLYDNVLLYRERIETLREAAEE